MSFIRACAFLFLIIMGTSACLGAIQQERVLNPAPRDRVGVFEDVWSPGEESPADSAVVDVPLGDLVAPGVRVTYEVGSEAHVVGATVRAPAAGVVAYDASTGGLHGLDEVRRPAMRVEPDPSSVTLDGASRVKREDEASRPWWRPDVRGWFSGGGRDTEESGRWVARFDGDMPSPESGQEDAWGAHPSGGAPPMTWKGIGEFTDSVMVYRDWTLLHRHLVPTRPLVVRELVWPTHARVASRDEDVVRIETAWVPRTRFSADELSCVALGSQEALEEQGELIRLVGMVTRHPGGHAKVTTTLESSDGISCEGSDMSRDRVQSFRWDMWMAINRASSIGTERLPPR
jgi:hypothetical protein